ncbi:hypothetical protein L596_015586 [Steinernema carpocapsae]|uniref:Tyrosine-protein kinase n=1 Tax=Steinernema carpocapsae TaxID=34508 RepID=A0A4U5NGF1_STECR|nr:hypothetical protein L596_015586 [Steinernema carpocapsae]
MPAKKVVKTTSLEEQDYYHGLLPREDLTSLLKEDGDFLIRTADAVADPRVKQVVVSIRCAPPPSKDKPATTTSSSSSEEADIKNLIVQAKGKEFFLETKAFKSIVELVKFYVDSKTPVISGTEVILKRPIAHQSWELRFMDITLKDKLGSGAFGDVHRGLMNISGRKHPVAVKVARGDKLDKEKAREIMKEARVMRKFHHPNVVKMFGVMVEQEPFMLVMELVNGPSLDKYLKDNIGNVSDHDKIHKMCAATAYGLEYLHSVKVIHRDIAARNLLYDLTSTLKITDFGLSKEGETYQMHTTRMLPVRWLSPETMETGIYTTKSDVYSYGVVVFEIFSDGFEPFMGMNNLEIQKMVLSGGRLEMPPLCPEELGEAIRLGAWSQKPAKRWMMSKFVEFFEKEYKTVAPQVTPKKEATQAQVKKNSSQMSMSGETLDEGATDRKASSLVPKKAVPKAAKPKKTRGPEKKGISKKSKKSQLDKSTN